MKLINIFTMFYGNKKKHCYGNIYFCEMAVLCGNELSCSNICLLFDGQIRSRLWNLLKGGNKK